MENTRTSMKNTGRKSTRRRERYGPKMKWLDYAENDDDDDDDGGGGSGGGDDDDDDVVV